MAHEAWQALIKPEYRGRLGQRLGFVAALSAPPARFWIHAVSVGEVQAAAAVVHELQRRHPALPIVISTVTPTGAQRAQGVVQGQRAALLPAVRPAGLRAPFPGPHCTAAWR